MAIPSETAERLIALTIFWMITQEADIRMWILDEARKRGETFKREFMVDRSLDGCRLLPFPSVPWTTLPPRLALRWATEPKVRWALHRLGLVAGVVAAASTACRPVASAAFLALAAAEIYCVFALFRPHMHFAPLLYLVAAQLVDRRARISVRRPRIFESF